MLSRCHSERSEESECGECGEYREFREYRELSDSALLKLPKFLKFPTITLPNLPMTALLRWGCAEGLLAPVRMIYIEAEHLEGACCYAEA